MAHYDSVPGSPGAADAAAGVAAALEIVRALKVQGQPARAVILLVDRTKFGRTAPARVAAFERARCLITDQAPPAPAARGLKSIADEIIVASSG